MDTKYERFYLNKFLKFPEFFESEEFFTSMFTIKQSFEFVKNTISFCHDDDDKT